MCIEMFQKNKIYLIYRLLCLICFIAVILLVNSIKSLLVLFVFYCFFALTERSFKNIELIVISIVILALSYLFSGYMLFRIILVIDYLFYYLDTTYYDIDDEEINEKELIRFKRKEKKKGLNNMTALYITVHLVVLFIGIWVG